MATSQNPPLLCDLLPGLAEEIARALAADGEPGLASQIRALRVVSLCGCGDAFCASFYTGPQPDGSWGPGHKNVIPPVESGLVVLDVVDDAIRYVEVIDREDVRSVLLPGESAT